MRQRTLAVLCLSELVTNALIHARTGCAIRAVLEQNTLTVTVRDGGHPEPARPSRSMTPCRCTVAGCNWSIPSLPGGALNGTRRAPLSGSSWRPTSRTPSRPPLRLRR